MLGLLDSKLPGATSNFDFMCHYFLLLQRPVLGSLTQPFVRFLDEDIFFGDICCGINYPFFLRLQRPVFGSLTQPFVRFLDAAIRLLVVRLPTGALYVATDPPFYIVDEFNTGLNRFVIYSKIGFTTTPGDSTRTAAGSKSGFWFMGHQKLRIRCG